MTNRYTKIDRKQIGSVDVDDLFATNSPSDGQVPSYNESESKFTWINSGGGVSTLQEAFDGGQTITIADGDNKKLVYTNNDVTNNPNCIEIINNTNSDSLYINANAVMTTNKAALHIYSNQDQISGRLLWIDAQGTGSTQPSMQITNYSAYKALYIVQAGVLTGGQYSIYLATVANQANAAYLLGISQGHASSVGGCFEIVNAGTGNGIYIAQGGVLASSQSSLSIYSNAIQINSPLALIKQDNASSTKGCLDIVNDGTGVTLSIDHNGASGDVISINTTGTGDIINISGSGRPFIAQTTNLAHIIIGSQTITNANDTAPAVAISRTLNVTSGSYTCDEPILSLKYLKAAGGGTETITGSIIAATTVGTGNMIYCSQEAVLATTRHMLFLTTNDAHVNADSALLKILQDNASSSEPCIEIQNDGSAAAIEMNNTNASGIAFKFGGNEAVSSAVGGTQDKKIRILVGATTYYLPCYTA